MVRVKVAKKVHPVDEGVVASLSRIKARIDTALDEYIRAETPLQSVEFNIRQSIFTLKEVRKTLLHGGHY